MFTELRGRFRLCKHCERVESPKGLGNTEDDEGDDEGDDEDDELPESATSPGQHSGGSNQPGKTSSPGLPSGSGRPGGSESTVSHTCISLQIDYPIYK